MWARAFCACNCIKICRLSLTACRVVALWLGIGVMKKLVIWLLSPVLAFGVLCCKKKDDPAAKTLPDTPAEIVQDPKPAGPAVAVSAGLSAQKRAELVGFAGHLPAATEYLISIHNGSDAARRVMVSKIWKTFAGLSGMQPMAGDDGDEMLEEAMQGPAAMFAHEFTIAMGEGTSEQLEHLVLANSRLSYYQMSNLVKMLAAEIAKKRAEESSSDGRIDDEQFLIDLINDEKSGVGLFEKINMPPMYVAFKTTEENRDRIAQTLASSLQFFGMFDGLVEPVDIKRGVSEFKGFRLNGANVAKEMEESKGDMEDFMPPATADRLIKAIAKKDLYVASGLHGDYAVLFIGASPDDLKFAETPSSSLAGSNALAFCDIYAEKDLLAISYGQSKGLQQVIDTAKGNFADMSAGIRNGLASSDEFGDTRNIDALLRMVEESEATLHALGGVEGGGSVAFFEEGLKIESYGGYDSGYNNWKAENRLAVLGENPGVMLFANVTSNLAYDNAMREYVETLFETLYAGAMKMSELPIEDSDFEKFKVYMQMFDAKFRVDLLSFWDGFSKGFDGSLGQERAFVVDLQGSMPAFPGVPQEMVDSAKFPRATWIAPVLERSKLAGSWEKMNSSMTSIAKTLSEMFDHEFPMQKPLSSEKNDTKTWFFPMPFFNDDFLPSVTVSDKWFAASSSKLQALDLINKAEAGGATSQGAVIRADFTELRDYAKQMTALMAKNNKNLPVDQGDLKKVDAIIDAFSELDSMNIHVRREGGQLRSSFHFRVAK